MKEHISLRKLLVVLAVSLLLLAADLLTKNIAARELVFGQKNPVINGFFYLTYCSNTGGAWSIFSGGAILLGTVSLVAALLIMAALFYCKNTLLAFSLGLVLSGAIGNMIDRFTYGFVVDFLDFVILGYDFPVFNVADICVVCGGIGILLTVLFAGKGKQLFFRPSFLRGKAKT